MVLLVQRAYYVVQFLVYSCRRTRMINPCSDLFLWTGRLAV